MGMLAGGTLLAVVAALSGELDDARFTREALAATAYMVVVEIAHRFQRLCLAAQESLSLDRLDLRVRQPRDRAPGSWAFNDEVITGRTLVAGAAIVAGVALMVSRVTEKSRRRL